MKRLSGNGESIIKLSGPWEFYWQKLLEPGAPLPTPDALSSANTYWANLTLRDGTQPTRTGVGTYRLVLEDFAEGRERYLWLHRALPGSGKVYLYPEDQPELAYVHSFGWSAQGKAQAQLKAIQQIFEAKQGQRWVILIQIQYLKTQGLKSGGLFLAPDIGVHRKSQPLYQMYAFQLASCLGLAFFVGISSLSIWLKRSQEKASLYLGLFSILFAMRCLFYFGLFFEWWAADLRFTILFELWTRIAMIATIVPYFTLSFPNQSPSPRIATIAHTLNGLAALSSLAAIGELVALRDANYLTSASHLFGLLLCLFIACRAIVKRPFGVGLLMLGFSAFLLASIHDVYFNYHEQSPSTVPALPFGIALFLIFQAQLVTSRFVLSFRKVEHYAREIADKEKARTLFFHNTSHELRTPLNGILGFLELMQAGRYGPLNDKLAQQINKCLRLAEGLKLQVDTILDIAKARRGGLATRMQKFSIEELLQKTNTLAEGLVSRSPKLSFEAEFDQGSREYPYFICDREKIFAILRNLVGNAIKFSDKQRPNHVRLKLALVDNKLLIEVHDQGIGIAPEHHQKIFEEFAQVETHSQRRFEGTGLGLTMVRDFVRVLGGTLRLQSEPGRGSSFFLEIPEGRISDAVDDLGSEQTLIQPIAEASSLQEPIHALKPTTVGHGWDILVIDDNASNCELISDILEQDSFHIRTALSGAEGLRSMRREKPHVILLDMMMPEMSGEDVLKTMRSDPELADIAVVIITARASDEDRYLGLSIGADDYLAKPILAAELRLRIQNLIHRQKLVLQSQQMEAQAKLSQLGELFRDLSHELKNIFQGGLNGGELSHQQIEMSLAPLSLQHLRMDLVRQSLVDGSCITNDNHRTWPFNRANTESGQGTSQLRNLGQILSGFPFSEQEWNILVTELKDKPEEELLFLENQLNLLVQVRSLQQSLLLGRELALSTLAYTRNHDQPYAQPLESLRSVQAMAKARLRRHHIDLKIELEDRILAIAPGHLMQILLNLVLNAIDAIQNLAPEERWIRVTGTANHDHAEIHVENGGPAIPPEVQERLFQRGFSTKGDQGSGIGLHVSSKLAREAHGDLSYDRSAPHPRFVLILPSAREEALTA